MGQSRYELGLSSLVATACTLAFLVHLHIASAAAEKITQATSSLMIPPAMRDRLSPLTRRQVVYYGKLMKRGGENYAMSDSVLNEFCESGRLLCGASLHIKSAWADGGVVDANTRSSANLRTSEVVSGSLSETVSVAPCFTQWKRKIGRMGDPEGLMQHGGRYFREKDLLVGAKLVLPPYLYEPSGEGNALSEPSFLPAPLALSLPPFDSHHLSELLQLFHIPSDSRMARQVKKVLGACDLVLQSLGNDNDFITSFCATSFEAMVHFASSMLSAPNNMIQALTNSEVVGRPGSKVTIVRVAQLATAHDAVDCHYFTFPFRVMGCHRIKDSKAFKVSLASEDQSLAMELLVACHKNTTLFNPHSQAFSQLKSSPGHTDICHWLPNNDNMWIPL